MGTGWSSLLQCDNSNSTLSSNIQTSSCSHDHRINLLFLFLIKTQMHGPLQFSNCKNRMHAQLCSNASIFRFHRGASGKLNATVLTHYNDIYVPPSDSKKSNACAIMQQCIDIHITLGGLGKSNCNCIEYWNPWPNWATVHWRCLRMAFCNNLKIVTIASAL